MLLPVRLKLILFSFLFCSLGQAQIIDNHQDPPGIDWKTIDSEHFEIIYPAKIRPDAQRVANLLEYLYLPEIRTMQYPFKKMTLLLSTNSAISNGYVTLAPRRSEWYATPFQMGSDDGDWYTLLAVHEMRHMAQFDRVNHRGLNLAWYALAGELGWSAVDGLLIPRWFWEGDAVLIETLLGKGGRGRKPDFDMGIRANQLSGKLYSYYKAMLGSYKDFVPNPYPLGYLLTSYLRKHSYPEIWSDVLGRSAFFSFFPFAFSVSLKGISKQNTPTLYHKALSEFSSLWQKQQDSLQWTACRILSKKPTNYSSYLFPQTAADGSVYSIKSGPDTAPLLVQLSSNGKEYPVTPIAPINKISVSGSFAVWERYQADKRWGKQNFADLILLDLKTQKKRKLTSGGKFFTPDLSPDNKQIVAIQFTTDRQCRLVLFDTKTGQLKKQIANPENLLLKTPTWSADGQEIVFTAQSGLGKSIQIYNLNLDKIETLVQNTWLGISNPILWKNYVLFSSGLSGIDNIYALHRRTGQPYQITSRPFGAFNPALKDSSDVLMFNDYSASGFRVAEMELDTTKWLPVDQVQDVSLHYIDSLIYEEQSGDILQPDAIPKLKFVEQDYNSWRHLFNFHSWQLNPDTLNLGAFFYSTNILNTLTAGAGLFYNRNEGTFAYYLRASYGGFYPLIDLGLQKTYRSEKFAGGTAYWDESIATLGLRLPLDLSSGLEQLKFYLSSEVELKSLSSSNVQFSNSKSQAEIFPLRHSFSFGHAQQKALKDVRFQWAQSFLTIYEHTPFKSDFEGKHFFSRLKLYFPGLLNHHSLLISSDYEWQDPLSYRFQANISFPRGYKYSQSNSFIKTSVDYELPVFYPDWDLGAWFYLKRVKLNLFYDYGRDLQLQKRHSISSAGLEVLLDQHWFSLPVEFEGGYRFVYRPNQAPAIHEIIIRLPLD